MTHIITQSISFTGITEPFTQSILFIWIYVLFFTPSPSTWTNSLQCSSLSCTDKLSKQGWNTYTHFVTLRFITKGYLWLHIFFQFSFFYEIAVPSEMLVKNDLLIFSKSVNKAWEKTTSSFSRSPWKQVVIIFGSDLLAAPQSPWLGHTGQWGNYLLRSQGTEVLW